MYLIRRESFNNYGVVSLTKMLTCIPSLSCYNDVKLISPFKYTMWYAALLRFIRRRLVLGIIFASSLTYCIVSFLREGNGRHMVYQDISLERKPFVWRTLQEHNETNEISCRNSLQGKSILVDDRGYVCQREDVAKNGCCNIDSEHTTRYSCNSCNESSCCIMFEYCVSCCIDPSKRSMLEVVLSKLSADEKVLFHSISDDYELCMTKCRTSSHSVLHENSYKNPAHKYCFGNSVLEKKPPD